MRSESVADRRRGGEAERHDRADRFANAPEDYKFSYSREISKYIMSTGKFKGTNLKISVTFKTSQQKNQQMGRCDAVCVPRC